MKIRMERFRKMLAFWTGCNIPGASCKEMMRFQTETVQNLEAMSSPSESEVMVVASQAPLRQVKKPETRPIARSLTYEPVCHGVRMLMMYPQLSTFVIGYDETQEVIHLVQRTSEGLEITTVFC